MRGTEHTEHITGTDIGLVIFAIVAGWLLLFQSGLF
jgi:hypothetical protein